jgi:hypothetical protein
MTEVSQPTEVDPLGPDRKWASLEPMIVFMVATGGILSLAAWKNWTWAWIVGLVLTAVWALGFLVARNRPERWFRW